MDELTCTLDSCRNVTVNTVTCLNDYEPYTAAEVNRPDVQTSQFTPAAVHQHSSTQDTALNPAAQGSRQIEISQQCHALLETYRSGQNKLYVEKDEAHQTQTRDTVGPFDSSDSLRFEPVVPPLVRHCNVNVLQGPRIAGLSARSPYLLCTSLKRRAQVCCLSLFSDIFTRSHTCECLQIHFQTRIHTCAGGKGRNVFFAFRCVFFTIQ